MNTGVQLIYTLITLEVYIHRDIYITLERPAHISFQVNCMNK